MTRSDVYHADPEIMRGTPVFTGTRVPVPTLVDHLAAGVRLDAFLLDFPTVRREQAVAFLPTVRREQAVAFLVRSERALVHSEPHSS